MSGPLDLTNVFIEDTYQRLIQTDGVYLYDGTGSLFNSITASLFGTASYALNGGVTQLLAGSNITLSPTNGLGQVTITSTGGSGGVGNTSTGSYGSFYDTTTQTNPVANIPRSMSFNSTDITNGVSISGSTNPFNTYIKTENAGIYNIQFSAQVEKTDSGTDEIVIWLRKNGIDLSDTATTMTLVGNNTKVVTAWNWFVTSAANDYYQIIWVSADTSMRLLAETISATHPGIPSVILTANRVDQFLSNTGSFSGSFTGHLIGTADVANVANSVTTLNQDLIVSEGYKIYINSPAAPSAGISSYSDPISQLTSVGQYSGDTIKGTAGDSLNPGQLIYLNTDGLWYLADATPDATNGSKSAINLLGILVGNTSASTNDDIVVLLQGNVCADQVTVGTGNGRSLWVSVDAGSIQNAAPSSTNNVVRQVGHMLDTNIIRFSPDNYFSIVP